MIVEFANVPRKRNVVGMEFLEILCVKSRDEFSSSPPLPLNRFSKAIQQIVAWISEINIS